VESALALEEAGCFSIVLELMASETAAEITSALKTTATIGIGAGPHCDGQVLVVYDMLGLTEEFKPRFVRRYSEVAETMRTAFRTYIKDVKAGKFPTTKESY
jgi:3-methyl-2-oxobutanoate hydroxymethyltransferase